MATVQGGELIDVIVDGGESLKKPQPTRLANGVPSETGIVPWKG